MHDGRIGGEWMEGYKASGMMYDKNTGKGICKLMLGPMMKKRDRQEEAKV